MSWSSTDTLEGGVEVSSKTCNFVLLQLISSPVCEDSSCSISRARTSISNMLASKDSSASSIGGLWSAKLPVAGSGAEPQPKSNLVHFSFKI